jgi:cytochrome c oxidase subunit 2
MGVDVEIQNYLRLKGANKSNDIATSILRFSIVMVLVFSLLSGSFSFAQSLEDLAAGEALFANCALCHGAQGQGNEQTDGPKLTGRNADYLTRQLHNFKDGLRGYLPVDLPGSQMAAMSPILVDDAAIQNVVAYIQTLPDLAPPPTGSGPGRPYDWKSIYARTRLGEASRGEMMYLGCSGCHGLNAEGLAELGAPRLRGRQDWYLIRQIKYFRDGIRGAHPRDARGQEMAVMTRVMGSRDQVIYDVVAYINSQ